MKNQADLNVAIESVSAKLTAEIEQIKEALLAKVPADIDLTAEITKLNALGDAISGIIPDEVPPADPGVEV